ncbi:MAG: alanine dehydrogenase, partial [Burkholderiales bacterium]
MRIGVPREIKDQEYRVGVTPAGVQLLVADGHEVHVEVNAGAAVGFDDAAYQAAGARLVATAAQAYAADLVIKVKELQPVEFALTQPAQILFCYQHLAPAPLLLAAMLDRRISCLAYETVNAA